MLYLSDIDTFVWFSLHLQLNLNSLRVKIYIIEFYFIRVRKFHTRFHSLVSFVSVTNLLKTKQAHDETAMYYIERIKRMKSNYSKKN